MKNQKQNLIKNIIIFAFIGIIFTQSGILIFRTPETHSNRFTIPPITADDHDPIWIDGNDDLTTFIANEGLSGSGTYTSPYIIENYHIYIRYSSGIEIRNTDAYLIIQNCKIEEDDFSHY